MVDDGVADEAEEEDGVDDSDVEVPEETGVLLALRWWFGEFDWENCAGVELG